MAPHQPPTRPCLSYLCCLHRCRAALKPAGLDRYWGVRISIPAKATKWPLLLFMLSDADPSRFSFGACL